MIFLVTKWYTGSVEMVVEVLNPDVIILTLRFFHGFSEIGIR